MDAFCKLQRGVKIPADPLHNQLLQGEDIKRSIIQIEEDLTRDCYTGCLCDWALTEGR